MKNFQNKAVDNNHKDLKLNAPPVTDYMVSNLITFKEDTEINVVIESLLSNRITGAPVLDDDGNVVGIIDDKDCLKVVFGSAYYDLPSGREIVGHYMSDIMMSINDDANIIDAANIFLQTTFKRLLVKDDGGKLVGQISRRDVLRAIKDMKKNTW